MRVRASSFASAAAIVTALCALPLLVAAGCNSSPTAPIVDEGDDDGDASEDATTVATRHDAATGGEDSSARDAANDDDAQADADEESDAANAADASDAGDSAIGDAAPDGPHLVFEDAGCVCTYMTAHGPLSFACDTSLCNEDSVYICDSTGHFSTAGACNDDAGPPVFPCPSASNSATDAGASEGGATATCLTQSQYCIVTGGPTVDTGHPSSIASSYCAPLPTNCTTCDCAQTNAASAWSAGNGGSQACTMDTTQTCVESNGQITVLCGK